MFRFERSKDWPSEEFLFKQIKVFLIFSYPYERCALLSELVEWMYDSGEVLDKTSIKIYKL